jgi:hypothetical protein
MENGSREFESLLLSPSNSRGVQAVEEKSDSSLVDVADMLWLKIISLFR